MLKIVQNLFLYFSRSEVTWHAEGLVQKLRITIKTELTEIYLSYTG